MKRISEWNKERWDNASGWRGYLIENEKIRLEDRVIAVIRLLEPNIGAAFLDIGCSDGMLTSIYAQKIGASTLCGVDICRSEAALKRGIDLKAVDLNDSPLPFPDLFFDRITICETLEHLVDPEAALEEIRRVLKPDGAAIISVPRADSKLAIASLVLGFQPPGLECSLRKRYGSIAGSGSEPSGHMSHFTKKAFFEMIRAAGFVIDRFEQRSLSSGWKLARKANGKAIGLIEQIIFFIYDLLPFKQDVMIVRIKKHL